jgi:hypothetical protein
MRETERTQVTRIPRGWAARRAEVTAPQGAARGALAAAGGALLTIATTAVWTPRLLATVLGPAPFPAVLAAASAVGAVVAGALIGRWAVRVRRTSSSRLARIALRSGLAYLAAVALSVAAMSLLEQGPVALAFPFALVTNGLAVALLLLPWAALPVLATSLVIEGWTRPPARLLPDHRSGPDHPTSSTRLPGAR